jgi:hypothetical protein
LTDAGAHLFGCCSTRRSRRAPLGQTVDVQLSGTQFAYIAGAMGLSVSSPGNVYRKVEKACADASLEPSPSNFGAELKVRNGSTFSARTCDVIRRFEDEGGHESDDGPSFHPLRTVGSILMTSTYCALRESQCFSLLGGVTWTLCWVHDERWRC